MRLNLDHAGRDDAHWRSAGSESEALDTGSRPPLGRGRHCLPLFELPTQGCVYASDTATGKLPVEIREVRAEELPRHRAGGGLIGTSGVLLAVLARDGDR